MQQERFEKVHFISISATSTTEYYRIFDYQNAKFLKPLITNEQGVEVEMKPEKFVSHKGYLSVKGQRNLKRSVNNFLLSQNENILINGQGKENISFLTLTLASSQIKEFHKSYIVHYADDKEIKKHCFNQFMTELRQMQGVKEFVWVAEKQINADLHFHLLIDKMLNKDWVRERWNSLQNKFGFVDRYHEKMKNLTFEEYKELRKKENKTDEQLKKAYNYGKSTNWMQPNSTDIKSLKSVKNVAGYIAKYMSKGTKDGNDNETIAYQKAIDKYFTEIQAKYECNEVVKRQMYEISGRIWQCSQNISKSRKCIEYLEDTFKNEINEVVKTVKDLKVYAEDYFTTICYDYKMFKNKMKSINEYFINHIKKTFENVDVHDITNNNNLAIARLVPVGVRTPLLVTENLLFG